MQGGASSLRRGTRQTAPPRVPEAWTAEPGWTLQVLEISCGQQKQGTDPGEFWGPETDHG